MQTIAQFVKRFKKNLRTRQTINKVAALKKAAMTETLAILRNFVYKSTLKETGVKLKGAALEIEVQKTFWEFREEGLINAWMWFNDATRRWILTY